jgi:hypothetical protein
VQARSGQFCRKHGTFGSVRRRDLGRALRKEIDSEGGTPGLHLVVLKVESGHEPCDFQGKYYERHGANVSEVPQAQYTALFRRFLLAKG